IGSSAAVLGNNNVGVGGGAASPLFARLGVSPGPAGGGIGPFVNGGVQTPAGGGGTIVILAQGTITVGAGGAIRADGAVGVAAIPSTSNGGGGGGGGIIILASKTGI